MLGDVSSVCAQGDSAGVPAILPLRERADVVERWLERRFETVLPMLMRREGIDMWIISAREYNEDPVLETMLPANWMAAKRRTVLILSDPGLDQEVERLAVVRYDLDLFTRDWDPELQPDQWARVAEIVAERDPRTIAVNRSSIFALADGLTGTEYAAMQAALPARYRSRVVDAERLAVRWLETRIPEEMDAYAGVIRIARSVIVGGLSNAVIHPGVTSTEDLVWWYRERIEELKLKAWFHPEVLLQRRSTGGGDGDFSAPAETDVIRPGDLLHVDVGITYLGLNTDIQYYAYILRPGETEPPEGLQNALAEGNRLQDVLTKQFVAGRTGNEILAAALAESRMEGIDGTIYSHPLGLHGHGAGVWIGMWDQQESLPGLGDHPLFPNTAYAIELNAAAVIPEWNDRQIRVLLEADAFFDGQEMRYIDGRQTMLLVIGR
jgi:hypothetical protein